MPVGAPLGSLLASRIVGRDEPLAILEALLAGPSRGGGVIALVGDAGMARRGLRASPSSARRPMGGW